MDQEQDRLKPMAITVAKAKELSGLGLTKLWELISAGELETVSVGRRRLVVFASLERLLSPRLARDIRPQ